jgi:ACS family D-galactonate transporter-like MFS transporter
MSATPPSRTSPVLARPTLGQITQRQRWTIVLLLFVASMINYLDRTTVSFALPLISDSLGLKATAKGVLLSAFFWSYALMQIPIGLLADRVNLRWLYAGAFALWSLAQGLTGLATGLVVLIGFRVLLGIGEAIYLPGGTKIVSLLFPVSERGLPCGLFDSGTRAGMFLGGLLVPWSLNAWGWRFTFAIIGFTAMLWLVPWLLATPREMKAAPIEEGPAVSQAATREGKARYGDLCGICLGFFCFDYYWYLLVTWLPDYLVTVRHLSIVTAGISASLPFMVFALCQPLGGWLADRLVKAGWDETRARKGVVTVAFLSGLLLIPAAWTSSPRLAILFIMGGCLVGLSTANQLVILQACAPPDQVGSWTGIYNFVGNLAGILAPLITGELIDWTHSYTPAFILAAVLIAAGQFSYWFLVGKVRSPADASSQAEE